MNELATEIWKKHIQNWFETSAKVHELWAEERAEEAALKLNQQITECREEVEKLTTAEIADIIVTATNENERLRKLLKKQKEELLEESKALEQIKNIIIEKYNLRYGDDW